MGTITLTNERYCPIRIEGFAVWYHEFKHKLRNQKWRSITSMWYSICSGDYSGDYYLSRAILPEMIRNYVIFALETGKIERPEKKKKELDLAKQRKYNKFYNNRCRK